MVNIFPIKAQGAQVRRAGRVLIGPVDLALDGSPCTIIVGPNGAGKTTTLRLLSGAARVAAGDITWAADDGHLRANQGFVFQRPVMLRRSVLQNISYPLRQRGVDRKTAHDAAAQWADKIGLGKLLDRQAPALSGGEQQKLALARALILKPQLLFLDEPCAALDGHTMHEVEQILHEAMAQGTKLIMSTHNMGQAKRLAHEVVFMLGGKVKEHSPAEEFFNATQTHEAAAFLRGDIV